MSYLERTFSYFLKTRIFGGIKKLKQKEYLPFALIFLVVMTFNTSLAILYKLNILVSLDSLQAMLMLELFLSFGIILSGLVIGNSKNKYLYYIIPSFLIALFIAAFFILDWSYNQPFFQYTKLIYFLIWVAIASISFFFLMLYFFTSFPKKIITLGMPKEHIFFKYMIKLLIYVSLPIYAYMILESLFTQITIGGLIIGILGIVSSIIVLIYIERSSKKIETTPGIINFATALGFFNMFMFYHLIMSFSDPSTSLSSLIIDVLILSIIILYIVQSLTRKIVETPTQEIEPFKSPVRFQSRLYITDRLKKGFGERGLVVIIIGLALGYHMVILDSFLISEMPFLSGLFTPNLMINAIYHRIYLLFSFITIIIAIYVFSSSKRFNEFMVDKYTVKQTFKYISSYFLRPEKGSYSPFEHSIVQLGDKIKDGLKSWGDRWAQKIQGFIGEDENSDKNEVGKE